MIVDLMRDTSRDFRALENPKLVRSLRVWHCKYRTLKPVGDMTNLEELVVASFPDETLDMLGLLKKLRYLSILHLPKVSNLDVLAELPMLETLSLATSPSWDASGKCLEVDSLDPISKIVSLKHLELFGVCPENKSLSALAKCKNLKSARFSQFPTEELDRFYDTIHAENLYSPKCVFEKK